MIFLMAALSEAERDFLTLLYTQYRIPMWCYAFKITGCRSSADDTVQSAFVQLLDKADLLESLEKQQIDAYITITVRRLAVLQNDKDRKVTLVGAEELEAVPDDGAAHQITNTLDKQVIRSALECLSIDNRDLITLRYLYDHSFDDIGCFFGITANAARVRLHRALKQLKSHMLEGNHAGQK